MMDMFEYFYDNTIKFVSRFRPINHKKNDDEQQTEYNNLNFNIPELDEITVDEYKTLLAIKIMTSSLTSVLYYTTNSFGLLYKLDAFLNGFIVAFLTTPYTTYIFDNIVNRKAQELLMYKETEEYINSFEYKYHEFLCDKIEEMQEIYRDDSKFEEYSRTNDLKSLKDKSNHMTIELPFENNTKMTMYYDDEEDAFIYYTERGDVIYNVLNSCCRSYVIENKCLNLYNDEDEIEFFKSEESPLERTSSDAEIAENFDVVEEDEMQKDDNKSLFKTQKNPQKSEEKEKKIQEKKINKFIHRGNMADYEESIKEKKEAKKVDYNAFRGFWNKNPKQD
jgi:hypothetical protein